MTESAVNVTDTAVKPAARFSPTDILQGAGAAAGTTAIIYVVGGMVMWLRFRKAGLPPDHAVALMDRQQLLVIGLRLMVLPAALTGAVAWWIIFRERSRSAPLPETGRRAVTVLKWSLAVLAAVFALMLPFSFASATWVLAALIVVGYLRYERRPRSDAPVARPEPRRPERQSDGTAAKLTPRRVLAWLRNAVVSAYRRVLVLGPYLPFKRRERAASRLVATMLVVMVAALVSLGRQLDQPIQLLSATVNLTGTQDPILGQYISSDGDEVFLGVDKKIRVIPRSAIGEMTIGPPRERAPSPSIASRVLGNDRFAITPFEWWCNGERYSWEDVGDLCQTQPFLADNSIDLSGNARSFVPVKVSCPVEAKEPCAGFVRMTTKRGYQFGTAGIPRPVSFDTVLRPAGRSRAAAAGVVPGRREVVCVPVDKNQRGLLRNKVPYGSPKGATPEGTVAFNLTISEDDQARSVVQSSTFYVNVPPPGEKIEPWSECSKAERVAARTRSP